MIVGTAGHIDHGKTTLVRALTGVDTDRLPEEKRRGISIELGYAYLDAGDGRRIGFIDVPGHERLVHTMVAGATGIDFVLLLVAADDGVMPQTREHLAVVNLLGIQRGAVVVTKCDRVAPERVAEVVAEAHALVAGTALAHAPVLPVCATTGDGMAALSAVLRDAAGAPTARDEAAHFRLAIDRAFVLPGAGTVVTGTVHAGRVRVGDELCLVPGTHTARVRSIHAQNVASSEASAGQRCALALPGLPKDVVSRGQWLCAAAAALSTERFDLVLQLAPGDVPVLRSGDRLQVHAGAAGRLATLALLDTDRLGPGEQALAQLVCASPVSVWRGDRLLLRDAGATRTLGGGLVLDPHAPTRYRRTPERLAQLAAWSRPDPDERLRALLHASPLGLDLDRHQRAEARPLATLPPDTLRAGAWALPAEADWGPRMVEHLERFHREHPELLGPDAARLRRMSCPRVPEPLFRSLLDRLQQAGRVQQRGACWHLPSHGLQLGVQEQRIAQKVAPWLERVGFEGAWVRDLARDCGESEVLMRVTLARLAQQGDLHQVVKDLYLPLATVTTLAALVRRMAADGEITAAAFRDATGLGRKRAIQLLEYFDRIGLLRRVGDAHRLRADSTLFAEAA